MGLAADMDQYGLGGRQGSVCTRRADKDYSVLGGRQGSVGARMHIRISL